MQRADLSQDDDVQQMSLIKDEVPSEQQNWRPSLDQEDEKPPEIKEEQEEAEITEFIFSPVHMKSEDDEEKPQSSELHPNQIEEDRDFVGPELDRYLESDYLKANVSYENCEESSEPISGDTSGQKFYSCTECGKTFHQRSHWLRHGRVHTGENPFDSSVCVDAASFFLPSELRETIPVQDQRWISNTLFRSGKLRPDLELCYEPPAPALICHQAPTPDCFFSHRLLVWMPYHQWKVRVFCRACGKHLTGAGIHKRARKVLDIDRFYLLVTETLKCSGCNLTYLATSQTIRDQLDLPHQKLFRLILTRNYACDMRVIRMMGDRTQGNSFARLLKQLKESHREEWLDRLGHYFEECSNFVNRPSLFPVVCQEPPKPIDVPTDRWLLSVYGRDILSRIDHIKASITSTMGTILKMDSNKKIMKKLAGHDKGTALLVSSVGNEKGQILTSVLTVQECPGLDRMAAGLMERYRQAGVAPPKVLYVDCGCCVTEGLSKLQARFGEWPDLHIRLNIWHFMRRLAVGCTTDAHSMYPAFMRALSSCIFEWDAGDLDLLRRSKTEQLQQEQRPGLTSFMVDSQITKQELNTFCRRRTRGEGATLVRIERLLEELRGPKGRDPMVGPLLDEVRMDHIWRVQKRHIKCIQDVPGIQLYTEVSSINKSGIKLTSYHCARGSSSLESFHRHLNRFIPGTSANLLNFQLYLLEGLNRWNQDRGTSAVSSKQSCLLTHAGDMTQCINNNALKLFGREYAPNFTPPTKYTGELLGVDYLLSQTGEPLKPQPDSEETEDLLEDVDGSEGEEDEGFVDEKALNLLVSGLQDDALFSVTSQLDASTHPAPSTHSPIAGHISEGLDESGVPGLDKVDSLAEHLVELRNKTSLVLSYQEVSSIVALWKNLLEFDKQGVVFAAWHQDKLNTGRFRSPKNRQEFTPGVESVKHCALTTTAPSAQWPDCCRLVETIFVRLCSIHRSPKEKGTSTVSRWDLILQVYRKIRQLILANRAIMQQTALQLVDVSYTTLVQWHNKRLKRQETALVQQGLNLPSWFSVAANPHLPANIPLHSAIPHSGPMHMYSLPSNTVEQAKLKRKLQFTNSSGLRQLPPAPPKTPRLITISQGHVIPTTLQNQSVSILFATHPHIPAAAPVLGRPLAPAPAPRAAPTHPQRAPRKLTRKVLHNTCKKCGQFRIAETGHSQYRGQIYCPSHETLTKEQWLEEIKKRK